jgi:hypothetical protein
VVPERSHRRDTTRVLPQFLDAHGAPGSRQLGAIEKYVIERVSANSRQQVTLERCSKLVTRGARIARRLNRAIDRMRPASHPFARSRTARHCLQGCIFFC